MAEKWIDRGKDAAPSLITPKALELAHTMAREQWERAERAEAEVAQLRAALKRYARHDKDCAAITTQTYAPCSCGCDAALGLGGDHGGD